MKDIIESIKDNFLLRIKNPFFGILLTITLWRHKFLIYYLFTFDSQYNQNKKIEIITNYLNSNFSILYFLNDIGLALVFLILMYLFLSLSKYLANIYDDRLIPWINSNSAPKNNIAKEKYDLLKSENAYLESRIKSLDEETSRKNEIIKRYDERINNLEEANKILKEENSKQKDALEESNKQVTNNSRKKVKDLIQENINEQSKYKIANKLHILRIIQDLKTNQLIDTFKQIVNNINEFKSGFITEKIKLLIEYGLLVISQESFEKSVPKYFYFKLTDIGEEVFNYLEEDEK